MMIKSMSITALAGAAALAFAAPAMSQQTSDMPSSGQRAPAQSQAQQINVSEEKMQDFVKVHQQVLRVQQSYQQKAKQQGADQEAAAAIAHQADEEAMKVVKQSPITLQEFNQMAMLLQQKPELQQRYRQILQNNQ